MKLMKFQSNELDFEVIRYQLSIIIFKNLDEAVVPRNFDFSEENITNLIV